MSSQQKEADVQGAKYETVYEPLKFDSSQIIVVLQNLVPVAHASCELFLLESFFS